MERAYRLRIYPTKDQLKVLPSYFGTARWVWNACLRWRSHWHKKFNESVTGIDFSRELTWLKKLDSYKWLTAVPATVSGQILRDQDKAFAHFFAKRAKYPKRKKLASSQSIRFQLDRRVIGNYFITGKLFKLPGLGVLDVRWSRIPTGIPKIVTLTRDTVGRYFISFMCEEIIESLIETGQSTGLDLGITDIIVNSLGNKSGNPRYLNKKIRRLKHYQRLLTRCQKGSQRRKRALYRVAKQHVRIAEARKDWAQKKTTQIIKQADVIALENLNVKGMMKSHHLVRAIGDVGMAEIRHQLEYKAQWYGRKVIVVDRFAPTSKVCSECGHLMNEMALSIRTWTCPHCGALHDRDTNAARNILALATGGRPESNARGGRTPPSAGDDGVAGMRASRETRTASSAMRRSEPRRRATKH